ncbi:MAG: glutathione S-transferase family protein, partial [Gammaproteobacteria bacterium]
APSPRRVRIFLAEKGVEVKTVPVNLREMENLKEEFLRINPRGVVPVLELDDGTRIDESVAICRYIEEVYPDPPLMGTDALSRARIESWQRHVEFDGYLAAVSVLRNSVPAFKDRGLPGLPPEFPAIPDLVERGRRQYDYFLEQLNKRLGESEYVGDDSYSIADITALVTVDFAARAKMAIPETCANIHHWYGQVSSRPSADA